MTIIRVSADFSSRNVKTILISVVYMQTVVRTLPPFPYPGTVSRFLSIVQYFRKIRSVQALTNTSTWVHFCLEFLDGVLPIIFCFLFFSPRKFLVKSLCTYVCMYVWSYIYSKSKDQPGKVANPARGQLNRENGYFPVLFRA